MTSLEIDHETSQTDGSPLSGNVGPGQLTPLARSGARPRLIRWRGRNLVLGALMIACIVADAIFAPWIAPRGPQETDYGARLIPPSQEHPFGTDKIGRASGRERVGVRKDVGKREQNGIAECRVHVELRQV